MGGSEASELSTVVNQPYMLVFLLVPACSHFLPDSAMVGFTQRVTTREAQGANSLEGTQLCCALVTSHISPGARVPCQPLCSGDVENLQEILGRRSSSLFFQCGVLNTVRNASSVQWGPSVTRCPLTARHTFKMRCLCRLLNSRKLHQLWLPLQLAN